MKRRLIKNAIANLGRGGASAIVALVLPPLLIRHMQPSAYAIWVLVLQVTAYMGFLDFGLQTAVARYIAFAEENKDSAWRDGIFSTALAGLSAAALLGILFLLAVAVFAGSIFPSIPRTLLPSMRWAILIAGTSTAVGLPASAWNGVFVGLQRYEFPAATITIGRLLTSVGLVFAAVSGRSLIFMSCVVCGANLLTYVSQFVLLRRIFPDVRFNASLITVRMVRELSGYCVSLTVWSFSTLLVTGFDLILVGRFQFSKVAVYSTAAVLITFLGGLQNSLFSVIMPHSAMLQARGSAKALGELLLKCTKLSTISLLLTGLPLVLFSFPLIRIWLGQQYAVGGSRILVILVIGNMIRLLGLPYASILVGTGQQRLILLSPLIEGLSNFVASILLGMKFGAIGVAWGTFIGAAAGLLATVAYSIPKTRKWIDQSPVRIAREVCSILAVCCLPIFLLLLLELLTHSRAIWLSIITLVLSILICIILALKSTLIRRSLNPWAW